ncbi:RDD family protein [Thiobaca trueperi]|uniref:Putative RDD family membrane protein YckC n=1 Tax=Thiobaca trueperi TaxID=127458 RepID=A0A4R3N3A2_9GAMM|nr:RDD family protein [Thiobaca trueperi]TCT22671.1 putative RDD family membrane protein YckC [Thiobaca trueperi]
MAGTTYRVKTTGIPQPGIDPAEVLSRLERTFPRIDPGLRRRMIAGTPMILKRGMDLDRASAFAKGLQQAGLECRIEPEDSAPPRLSLEPLSEESAPEGLQTDRTEAPAHPAPPPGDPRICPKCGYVARSSDDPLLSAHGGLGQCPRCGVIPGKLRSTQSSQALTGPVVPVSTAEPPVPTRPELARAPTVTLKERWLANLVTNAYIMAPALALYLLYAMAVISLHKGSLFTSSYFGVTLNRDTADALALGYLLLTAGFALYEYLVRPATQGATRGELLRGIVLVNDRGIAPSGIATFAKRFAGVLVNSIFLVTILSCVFDERRRTLADIFSGTRPIRGEEMDGGFDTRGGGIFLLGFSLLLLANVGVPRYLLYLAEHRNDAPVSTSVPLAEHRNDAPVSTSVPLDTRARDAIERTQRIRSAIPSADAQRRLIEQAVGRLETRYAEEHDGEYTYDLGLLLQLYGSETRGEDIWMLEQAYADGQVSLRMGSSAPFEVRIGPPGRHAVH